MRIFLFLSLIPLLFKAILSKESVKDLWEGITTRKEDLEVNWNILEKYENSTTYKELPKTGRDI